MNLKIALLVLLLFCVGTTVTAQDVVYSEYDKFDFRNDEYAVVGMCGSRLYTYRKTEDGPMLEAYNDSMDKVAKVLLDFFPEKIYEARFISYPDKIIALYQGLESGKVVQYAALLDEKGRLVGKPVELGSVKTGFLGATRSYFFTALSENKKNILIYSVNDKSESIEFEGKWLDDKATVIKRSKAVFKTENRAEHGEVSISNDGTVYMVAYSTTGAHSYADQYWILTLAPGATKFEPKELPLGEKFAASGYIKLDNVNSRIYFGGFYADKKNSNYQGLIYACYDISSAAYQSVKFIPFDQELISAAGARRRSHAFDNYEVRQLIVKNDGGFIMVSEVHYITTRNTFNSGFGYYSYYSPALSSVTHEYHYEDSVLSTKSF